MARDCADSGSLECHRVLVDGAEIFFQVSRSQAPSHRPPVVLVHGYGMSSRYMVPLALELAGDFKVYAPDLPGFGRSSKPRKVLNMVELADALAGWMTRIGLRRAAMIGNSMGCQVIVELAVRHQDRVDCLVLQGLTPDPAARTIRQQVWRQLVNSRYEVSPAITRIVLRDYTAAGPRRLFLTLRHLLRHKVEDQLPLITVPTLVVRGTRDAVVPREWARRAASLLPKGRLVEVASGAHIVQFHAPDRLARVLRRFLEPPDGSRSRNRGLERTLTGQGMRTAQPVGEDDMSSTGLEVFDKTLQITHIWLDEIMAELGPDRQRAYHALRAVLHALRDRLPLNLAAHLGAQLPLLVRGIFYDSWDPQPETTRERKQEEFLERVAAGLQGTRPVNVEQATRVVFGTIGRHVSAGQVEKVRDALPKDIQMLWPETTAAAAEADR